MSDIHVFLSLFTCDYKSILRTSGHFVGGVQYDGGSSQSERVDRWVRRENIFSANSTMPFNRF
jgi:hypothetical protein